MIPTNCERRAAEHVFYERPFYTFIVYLVGEGEADGLPSLNGDRDDQEDGGGEGEVTGALQNGEQEAQVVNLGVSLNH